MHSVLFVHLEEHNGRRFDGNTALSQEFYQTTSYSSYLQEHQASCHASVVFRILYKANHHQVSEPRNDSHQEQEQLSSFYQCKYLVS